MFRLAHGPGATLQQGIILLHGSSGNAAWVNYTSPSDRTSPSSWRKSWREPSGSADEGGR